MIEPGCIRAESLLTCSLGRQRGQQGIVDLLHSLADIVADRVDSVVVADALQPRVLLSLLNDVLVRVVLLCFRLED